VPALLAAVVERIFTAADPFAAPRANPALRIVREACGDGMRGGELVAALAHRFGAPPATIRALLEKVLAAGLIVMRRPSLLAEPFRAAIGAAAYGGGLVARAYALGILT
jgi:hypothetical protein